jgi:hypothetical protein
MPPEPRTGTSIALWRLMGFLYPESFGRLLIIVIGATTSFHEPLMPKLEVPATLLLPRCLSHCVFPILHPLLRAAPLYGWIKHALCLPLL